jgi:nucleoside-diphosphate-sugar epimerase
MKVLITGTKGFIGGNLKKYFDSPLELNEDTPVTTEWLDENKPEAVFHVGACSNTLETDVNYIMLTNYESTRIISDWCHNNNVPLIYSSSAACYGNNGVCPSNLYGWSKYVGEQYVLSRGGIALRYYNVYGPGEEHKGKMASMAFQMLKAGSTKLFPGEPKRDFIYVDDVILANLRALAHYDVLSGKKYDVGLGEAHSFEYIADVLDIPYTYHDQLAIPEGYQFYTCSNPRYWMPGWAPRYSLNEGLTLCKTYWQKLLTNQESGQCLLEDGNPGMQDTDGLLIKL